MIVHEKGTYILILQLQSATRLAIGRLGTFDFAAGWYAYVGSAFGPGGLSGRLKHHLAPVKKPHWHIDYLRVVASLREVWFLASDVIYEHRWAASLHVLPTASILVPRFGASDCKCDSHLIYFPQQPHIATFNHLGDWHVQQWQIDTPLHR